MTSCSPQPTVLQQLSQYAKRISRELDDMIRGTLRRKRAVLMTGDTTSAIKRLPRDPYLRITSKPINAEELLTLLRALLAAEAWRIGPAVPVRRSRAGPVK